MEETPQPGYQLGSWTVTKLKDELRSRNLSPMGNKNELIARLEQSDHESSTPRGRRFASPNRTRSPEVVQRSTSRSPIRSTAENMSIQQLREELKSRGMSPIGKKVALMQRLVEAENRSNPFMDAPSKALSCSASHSPSRRDASPTTSVAKKVAGASHSRMSPADIGLLTCPITTILLAARCALAVAKDFIGYEKKPLTLLNTAGIVLLAFAVVTLEGPHQQYLGPVRDSIMWYGRWVILGILSSIGLGTGAHTFLLFLGPMIARVATAAYVCRTLEFSLSGPNAMLCPSGVYEKLSVTFLMVLNKVKWEAFAWGLGTALGELPPYIVARASAVAGKSSGEVGRIEKLVSKKDRTWTESLQLASYNVVTRLGFFGILLCASIPNPLFDLAGITCGYFMIPFSTFALATVLGKAVIKTGIQSAFVVFLFSRDYMEGTVKFIQLRFPNFGKDVQEWLLAQRTVFQSRKPNPFMDVVGSIWHVVLISMMTYFVVSVIRSAAIMQARREGIIIQ